MKTDFIYTLTKNFEEHAQKTKDGVEFWLARDLQQLLGYEEWRNFHNVIDKAKTTCVNSGHNTTDRLADVNKTFILNLTSINFRQLDIKNKLD